MSTPPTDEWTTAKRDAMIEEECLFFWQAWQRTCTFLQHKDESKRVSKIHWHSWSQQHVTQWIQSILVKNIDDHQAINNFMIEFEAHCVNGKVLKKMKEQNVLKDFKLLFANQSFGIWMFVEDAILSLK